MAIHRDLAGGKWFSLSLADQLGNIGSEIGRALKRHQEGGGARFTSAFDRALELLDLTIVDPRWKGTGRLREILRSREVVCDFFFGGNQYGSTPEVLEGYFFHYACAARRLPRYQNATLAFDHR